MNGRKSGKETAVEEVFYSETVHFEDSETVGHFLELEKEDPARAVTFLAEWDYGENDGEPETLERITDGLLFLNRAEHKDYMALWQTGVEGVTLYRKVPKERNDVD